MLSDAVLYSIMGAGLAIGAACYFTSSGHRIRTSMAAAIVEKLCRAGNLDRAGKLCAAGPEVPYLAAVKVALAVATAPDLRSDRAHLRARCQEARARSPSRRGAPGVSPGRRAGRCDRCP